MFNSFLYHLGSLKGNSVLWDGPGSRSGAAGKEGGFGVWGGVWGVGGAIWAEIPGGRPQWVKGGVSGSRGGY